jgi:imidazolonepropionase
LAHFDLLLTDARIATLLDGDAGYGIVENGAIAVADGRIAWLGPAAERPHGVAAETRALDGRCVTPALIDCHTHAVFGGDRAAEFERRLDGVSYAEIAAEGGGILSTVAATRDASVDQLHDAGLGRLLELARSGVATVEIKSGYGLDAANELKMLGVARRLGDSTGLSVVTTLLALHAVPSEYAGRADDYVDCVVNELLPEAVERGLADAVDAYCESFAFSEPQVARLFRAAKAAGLPVKLHADQLSDSGGAELAAEFGALSADHLEYTRPDGVRALAEAGTTAVLLPGAYLTLHETQPPPVALLRELGVPIAIATDCNPGTSPLLSMPAAMALASRLFGLTPLECLAGATRNAARALGLADRGTLEAGRRADLAIWNIEHPRDLAYWMGRSPLETLVVAGREYEQP